MTVLGLDLSLTGTGWCVDHGSADETVFGTLNPGKREGMERFNYIIQESLDLVRFDPAFVVVEGLSFASNHPSAKERAGLFYALSWQLWLSDYRVQVVAPTQLKKFVTDSGKGEKSMMLREVYKRWHLEAANDNEDDAIGLAMIGRALLEGGDLSKAQREVIEAIEAGPKPKKARRKA